MLPTYLVMVGLINVNVYFFFFFLCINRCHKETKREEKVKAKHSRDRPRSD